MFESSTANGDTMKEPEVVRVYREKLKQKPYPPQCCYTCDHYAENSWCLMFEEKVPKDFAESIDQCPSWVNEVQF